VKDALGIGEGYTAAGTGHASEYSAIFAFCSLSGAGLQPEEKLASFLYCKQYQADMQFSKVELRGTPRMSELLAGIPKNFTELLLKYYSQISDAIRRNAHHDHRRALLMEFLRTTFGIEIDEIELELKIKAAEARGRIDAFYKFVIFEVKIDLDRERADAIRELKKYFESRSVPADYIAVVTDGLTFEVYDYNPSSHQPSPIRTFQLNPDKPQQAYLELDELLASGKKISPTSDAIVGRFGLKSTTFLRANQQLQAAFASVEDDSAVAVKFREWNSLLSKVYGSAVGDKSLFLRHTYLTILSRAIVTMALFPKAQRGASHYRNLLTGEFFRNQSILNLAEPDFFSWALDTVAEQPFTDVFHGIFRRLEEFDWTKVDEDLLKMLYQELIDPADRSGLGEYYTPDWLAEMMLEDIEYESGSLLDPSCGSGTFLFTAIHRLRAGGLSGKALVEYVMNNIQGLDVHPVAVLMAKANILIALAPEMKAKRDYDVQLRVYMSDTLQTEEKKGKKYIGVPDGMGHEFLIPSQSIESGRDLDRIIDQMADFAHRAAQTDGQVDQAMKGFLAKIKGLSVEESNYWRLNFTRMVDLVKKRRDTVWAFILKNAYRPAYLRRQKVDVIVGNPPWLSFHDIAEDAYKERIKELTFKYELLGKSERNLFTQMEMATLFYVHCHREFLSEEGKIAFVMPKTVILPSKQHHGFQEYGLTHIHDMSKVSVVGLKNQHFFNVKSCVVVDTGDPVRDDIPMTVWHGMLPRKNMTLRDARPLLTSDETTYSFLDRSVSQSPYYARAFQGATLNPHTLWFVEPDTSVSLNISRPLVGTSATAFALCKEKKWKMEVSGPVERELLFVTVLSDDILPFALRRMTLTVLPILVKPDRYAVVDSSEILAAGYPAGSDWTKRAEKIFVKGSKDKAMTAQERLNYQKLITEQNPTAPFIVLYNKSGTNLSAAMLTGEQTKRFGDFEVSGFVAESVTYRIYTDTEEEALYLVGVLNSTVVNEAIKPYQTEGVYKGKRDIHRRPFEVCPIPLYDVGDPAHQEIASCARAAQDAVAKFGPQLKGTLAKVRERTRETVKSQIDRIDVLVADILKLKPHSKGPEPKQVVGQRQEGLF
jgi:hypothetical protein